MIQTGHGVGLRGGQILKSISTINLFTIKFLKLRQIFMFYMFFLCKLLCCMLHIILFLHILSFPHSLHSSVYNYYLYDNLHIHRYMFFMFFFMFFTMQRCIKFIQMLRECICNNFGLGPSPLLLPNLAKRNRKHMQQDTNRQSAKATRLWEWERRLPERVKETTLQQL